MTSSFSISDELLSAYLDREISEAELRRVESALAADPALQERLYGLQQVVSLLQSAPSVVVPRPLTLTEEQVLEVGASVQGRGDGRGWQVWLARFMPMATAVVAVLFVLSFAWPMTPTGFLAEAPVVEMASTGPEVAEESQSGMMAQSREMGSGAALVPTSTMAVAASARAMPRGAGSASQASGDEMVSAEARDAEVESSMHEEEAQQEERSWALWASQVSPWTKGLGLLLLVMVGISGWAVWHVRG